MRKFCTDVLSLDEGTDVIDIASLVDSWESSTTRMAVRHKAEAEAGLASQGGDSGPPRKVRSGAWLEAGR